MSNNTSIAELKRRFLEALDQGDLGAADAVLYEISDEDRAEFDEWTAAHVSELDNVHQLVPTDREALAWQGVESDDVSMLAALLNDTPPVSVLVSRAMSDAQLAPTEVCRALMSELNIPAEIELAEARITRAIDNLARGAERQASRIAPDAVDALAKVLNAPIELMRRAFDAAESTSVDVVGAFAREGRSDVLLPDDLAAEDDDIVDQLFYRSDL